MSRYSAIIGLVIGVSAIGSADAAVSVFGNTEARQCYEAARYERSGPSSIRVCTNVLDDPTTMRNDRVATHVNRGILYVQNGNFVDALADYDRAIALDAREPEAYLNKALALLRRDANASEVLPLFDAAIEYGTTEPAIAHYGRAVAYELNGDVTAAYYDLQRAVELAPQWEVPARDLQRFVVR